MQGAYCDSHSHNKIVEAIGFDLRQASERTDARQGCGEIGAQGGRQGGRNRKPRENRRFNQSRIEKTRLLTFVDSLMA